MFLSIKAANEEQNLRTKLWKTDNFTTCVTSSKLVAIPPLGTGIPKLRITSMETLENKNIDY